MLKSLKWEQRWVVIMPTAVHIYKVRVRYLAQCHARLFRFEHVRRHPQTHQVPAHGTVPQQVVQLGMDAVVEELAQRQVCDEK